MITLGECLTYLDVRFSFIDRCNDLRKLGLAESIVDDLKASERLDLLEQIAALSPEQIVALNEVAA